MSLEAWGDEPDYGEDRYTQERVDKIVAEETAELRAQIAALNDPALVRVPRDPGACALDESPWLLAFVRELHSNVSESVRPAGWSDFSDDQRERIKSAWRSLVSTIGGGDGR